jgi:hypothetical protein
LILKWIKQGVSQNLYYKSGGKCLEIRDNDAAAETADCSKACTS